MASGDVAHLGAGGLLIQDGAGWTPLMIAVSLKEGEDLVKLFLSKGADVNAKSGFSLPSRIIILTPPRFRWSSTNSSPSHS
jgi:ankyrin repeat protein